MMDSKNEENNCSSFQRFEIEKAHVEWCESHDFTIYPDMLDIMKKIENSVREGEEVYLDLRNARLFYPPVLDGILYVISKFDILIHRLNISENQFGVSESFETLLELIRTPNLHKRLVSFEMYNVVFPSQSEDFQRFLV
jgi:hypothetical protein